MQNSQFGWHSQNSLRESNQKGRTYPVEIHLQKNLSVLNAWVRTDPDNEEFLAELKKVDRQGKWQTYCGEIKFNEDKPLTNYAFKLQTPAGNLWLAANGWYRWLPGVEHHFKLLRSATVPSWLQDQIFYQIYPDSFCNGDSSINLAEGEYNYKGNVSRHKEWNAPVPDKLCSWEFYGGDLPGIQQKLDYFLDLGITALYLNPIFASPSNHKYDCTDYYQVDPHLGGNQALVSLRKATAERAMKLVLDAVINHTSKEHTWLQKAISGDGFYRSFYVFPSDGDNSLEYACWKGHQSLAVLDFASPNVVEQCYAGEDSVLRHWLRPPFSIDGWRMDVIHMLGEGAGAKHNARHVAGVRNAIKQENPNACVIGEHFAEATAWMQGEHHDSAMNYYGFTCPVAGFVAQKDLGGHSDPLSAEDFSHWLIDSRSKIPFLLQKNQLNSLDTHDTMRFYSLVGENVALYKLAVTLQFTYIGVPCIYYGNEIGLPGANVSQSRRAMPWNNQLQQQPDILAFYRQLIALRKSNAVLRRGDLIDVFAQGDVYVFARSLGNEMFLVAINRASATRIYDSYLNSWLGSRDWNRVLGDARVQEDHLLLGEISATIWQAKSEA